MTLKERAKVLVVQRAPARTARPERLDETANREAERG
jgi:hypothetical protein